MRNDVTRCCPSVRLKKKRPLPLIASSSGWLPAPKLQVAPLGSSRVRLPSWPTEKPEIELPPAFAVYAYLPFFEATSQHGAPWCVATAPLIGVAPLSETSYEEAASAAFDASRWPRLSK